MPRQRRASPGCRVRPVLMAGVDLLVELLQRDARTRIRHQFGIPAQRLGDALILIVEDRRKLPEQMGRKDGPLGIGQIKGEVRIGELGFMEFIVENRRFAKAQRENRGDLFDKVSLFPRKGEGDAEAFAGHLSASE